MHECLQENCDTADWVRETKPVFCEKKTELVEGRYVTTRGCSLDYRLVSALASILKFATKCNASCGRPNGTRRKNASPPSGYKTAQLVTFLNIYICTYIVRGNCIFFFVDQYVRNV